MRLNCTTFACAFCVVLVLLEQEGHARSARASLRLMGGIRDLIHTHYVDKVDSLSLVDGAIDGMMAILPLGNNVYTSPREMAELGRRPVTSEPIVGDRQQVGLLQEAFNQVRRAYVNNVPVDTLCRGAVQGMLAVLDPHSNFLEFEEYRHMAEQFRGEFEGIGIFFELRNGKLLVISPIHGSPSDGKLRTGDHIVKIEGVSTEDITTEEVMEQLRGQPGSWVNVAVARQGAATHLNFSIERDRINVTSVPYVFMIRPRTAYVRILRFGEKTGSEVGEALDSLRRQGAQRLLLDLRGNGGGLLSQAVAVADYFVNADNLIVYTEGREPTSRQAYRARGPLAIEDLSLIVLIDQGSASASEIVAGAIQDLDLGLVVGQTSFGKGLVQEQFPLAQNGGLLLLTVARYYTPLGRLIQRPYHEGVRAYVEQGFDDIDPNAAESMRLDKPVFRTALGREVFGGGGITPDVVLNAEEYSAVMVSLQSRGSLRDFAGRWVGDGFTWGGGLESFVAEYQVSSAVVDSFYVFLQAAEQSVEADEWVVHSDLVANRLKAEIARVLWGDEGHYRVLSEDDRQILEALQLFDKADDLAARLKRRYRY